jgi:hypothetical protein
MTWARIGMTRCTVAASIAITVAMLVVSSAKAGGFERVVVEPHAEVTLGPREELPLRAFSADFDRPSENPFAPEGIGTSAAGTELRGILDSEIRIKLPGEPETSLADLWRRQQIPPLRVFKVSDGIRIRAADDIKSVSISIRGASVLSSDPNDWVGPEMRRLIASVFPRNGSQRTAEAIQDDLWRPAFEANRPRLYGLLGLPAPSTAIAFHEMAWMRVQIAQRREQLVKLGFWTADLTDGTATAVKGFQRSNDLPPTGAFDTRTVQALESDMRRLTAMRDGTKDNGVVAIGTRYLFERNGKPECWELSHSRDYVVSRHSGDAAITAAEQAHIEALRQVAKSSGFVYVTGLAHKSSEPALPPRLFGGAGYTWDTLDGFAVIGARLGAPVTVVIASHPLEQLSGSDILPWSTPGWVALRQQVREQCPTCRVILDDPTGETARRIASLPTAVSLSQVRVELPRPTDPWASNPGSLLLSRFKDAADAAARPGVDRVAVVALSGMRGEDLTRYVDSLGAATLKGTVLLLFSCDDPTAYAEHRRWIQAHGALAVLRFHEEIYPADVIRVTQAMQTLLESGPQDVATLPERSVDLAINQLDAEIARLRQRSWFSSARPRLPGSGLPTPLEDAVKARLRLLRMKDAVLQAAQDRPAQEKSA